MDPVEIGGRLALFFVPLLFALCFHEYAHGLVASWLGDDTAEKLGRLTLNPMAHADMVGTFILPISAIVFGVPLFIGWAKPVPVSTRNLKNVRTDMFWIAFAGPLSNLFLAFVTSIIMIIGIRFNIFGNYQSSILALGKNFLLVNISLAIFNLIPLHPLDGGKVLARFLPAEVNYKLEQNEQITGFILLGLMLSGVLMYIIGPPINFLYQSFASLINAGVFL
ncbi:MAG: site-2 protease family protein [Bdellovibrio sp.]|nr:site-2 protease family protein [Bdellovibrio sp.]